MTKALRVLLCIALAVEALLSSGCLQTALLYNPNMHQTGRTSGTNNVRAHFNASLMQQFEGHMERPRIVSHSTISGLGGAPGLSVGLSEHVDFGGSLELGMFTNEGRSIGVRGYVKDMLTDRKSPWAFALIPAVSYTLGSNGTAESTGSSMSSNMLTVEMHTPLSYHPGKRTAVFIEPQFILAFHSADFTAGPQEYSYSANQTLHKTWFGAGMGFGVQLGPFVPEVSLLAMDGVWRTLGGLGLTF